MPEFSTAKSLDEMPEAFVSGTSISREVSRAAVGVAAAGRRRFCGLAAAWRATGLQFQGSNSAIRLAGWSAIRCSTSASHAWGSTSLSLAVLIRV